MLKKAIPGPEQTLKFKKNELTLKLIPPQDDLWQVYPLTRLKV